MIKYVLRDNFKEDYETAKANIETVDLTKINEAVEYANNSNNEILINAMADMKQKALEPIQKDIDFVDDCEDFIGKYVDIVEVEDNFQEEEVINEQI